LDEIKIPVLKNAGKLSQNFQWQLNLGVLRCFQSQFKIPEESIQPPGQQIFSRDTSSNGGKIISSAN
jgi:hypothetical protein